MGVWHKMKIQRLLVNCIAVVIGASIAFTVYTTLHWEKRISYAVQSDVVVKQKRKEQHPNVQLSIKELAQNALKMQSSGGSHIADGFVSFNDDPEFQFRHNKNFTWSKCPSSLQFKLQSEVWTKDIYKPEIMQVIHKAVLDYGEYQRLLPYWMPYGYKYHEQLTYEDLMEIINLFSTRVDFFDFSKNSRPDCISCAVVGTGGILKGSKKGKEIDEHNMVFRVNNALTRGFEEDVGTRTTHYIFMDRSLIYLPKIDVPRDEGIKYLFLPCRLKDYYYIRDVVTVPNPNQKLQADPMDIRIFHPDFIRYFQKVWMLTKSFRPSTGAVMFFAALHGGCDKINVYGMGFNQQYSEHYYDKEYVKYTNVKGSHDFQKEMLIFKHLHRDGIINWYTRDISEFKS